MCSLTASNAATLASAGAESLSIRSATTSTEPGANTRITCVAPNRSRVIGFKGVENWPSAGGTWMLAPLLTDSTPRLPCRPGAAVTVMLALRPVGAPTRCRIVVPSRRMKNSHM